MCKNASLRSQDFQLQLLYNAMHGFEVNMGHYTAHIIILLLLQANYKRFRLEYSPESVSQDDTYFIVSHW